jgi:hypothetical protein
MSTPRRTLKSVQNTFGCFREVLSYGVQFLWAMLQPKAMVAARLLAVESPSIMADWSVISSRTTTTWRDCSWVACITGTCVWRRRADRVVVALVQNDFG